MSDYDYVYDYDYVMVMAPLRRHILRWAWLAFPSFLLPCTGQTSIRKGRPKRARMQMRALAPMFVLYSATDCSQWCALCTVHNSPMPNATILKSGLL